VLVPAVRRPPAEARAILVELDERAAHVEWGAKAGVASVRPPAERAESASGRVPVR